MLADIKRSHPLTIIIDVSLYEFSLRDKEIFRHRYLNEYSVKEIAEEYGISTSLVYVVCHKALKQLKTDVKMRPFFEKIGEGLCIKHRNSQKPLST